MPLVSATWVLLPVKSFAAAKLRLGAVLDDRSRRVFAERLATHVVACATPFRVAVVCDSTTVSDWAVGQSAEAIFTPALGLNGAVAAGVDRLRQLGADRVLIAHTDLPFARSFAAVLDAYDEAASAAGSTRVVVAVPDRHGDGTNVMCIPADVPMTFHYGPGSAALHQAAAESIGLQWVTLDVAELAWDVDTPADLFASDAPGDATPLLAGLEVSR